MLLVLPEGLVVEWRGDSDRKIALLDDKSYSHLLIIFSISVLTCLGWLERNGT